jgi:hypothetical protein
VELAGRETTGAGSNATVTFDCGGGGGFCTSVETPHPANSEIVAASKNKTHRLVGTAALRANNFFRWKVWPITDKLGIPRKLCTFQVFRRTLGTDLQKHGTMKDAQAIMRHKHIKTTGEVYMDHIPESVRKAIDSRTDAIFALRKKRRQTSSGVLLNLAGQSKAKPSVNWSKELAPQVGLEPTTLRLTAGCSAIELLRSGQTSRPRRRRPIELSLSK